MVNIDRTERCNQAIPDCLQIDSKIDEKFLWFLCHGNSSKGIDPVWLYDPCEEAPLNQIVSQCLSYSEAFFEAAALELILRKPKTIALGRWRKKWVILENKSRGRPRIPLPSIMAVLLRDYFIQVTGSPHYKEVGHMIWALFPYYAEKRRTGGGQTRQLFRKAAEDLCRRGPKTKNKNGLTLCYLEFIKIYQKTLRPQ